MPGRPRSISVPLSGELALQAPPSPRVKDIMTLDVVSVSPSASLGRIARLMHERAISGVPVVDESFTAQGR